MNKRREFLKTSSKLSAGAIMGVFGLNSMFGAESSKAKSAQTALAMPSEANKKGASMQTITLSNGNKMPLLGLGTYDLRGKECESVISEALELGYRLLDTAQYYKNEREIGVGVANAIRNGLKREEIFIETKLSGEMDYNASKAAIEERLKLLNVDYIDLLLIHWTHSKASQMWKAMEEAYSAGKLKAIGISNYLDDKYSEFIKNCKVIPMVNQLETNVFVQRGAFQDKMLKKGTVLQAWSPFAKGEKNFFKNEVLLNIGKKYNKSVAQIALKYMIERGICVIPKTSKRERLIENMSIFDFNLSSEDKQKIAALDEGRGAFRWYE